MKYPFYTVNKKNRKNMIFFLKKFYDRTISDPNNNNLEAERGE